MSFNVGLNIVEVDGRATPSIQAAPTSVAAFVIRSQRGVPEAVYQVTNWSQFTEHFGSYLDGAYGAYAVRGFFDNGGTTAYITRVVNLEAADPVATAASITSNDEAPWSLEPGGTLTFNIDAAAHPAEFTASPAQLPGFTGTRDLTGTEISLTVNEVEHGPYSFVAEDFDLANATPADVAAVLNREFPGIQAWVDPGDGSLQVRTDRRGSSASLAAGGTAAASLGLGADNGEGNVLDIEAVTPEEAAAVIGTALAAAPVTVSVTADGQVTIVHTEAGAAHSIQVDDTVATSVHAVFEFVSQPGTEGETAVAAVASTQTFSDGGATALTVNAGYRGQSDPGAWGDDVAVRIADNPEEAGTYDLFVQYNGNVVETWEKLNHNDAPDAPGQHPENVINDEFTGSKYIFVSEDTTANPATTDDTTDADPDGFVQLTGGGDDTLSGPPLLNALADALGRFDFYEVQLVCCPESDDATVVTSALTYCENRGDCMFVGHTPRGYDAAAAKAYGKGFQGKKIYGALYFPWIRVRDPIGTQKWIPPTGHVMGVYARTERERGIWKAPAGNAARVNGALDVEHHITDVDHTDLVKNGSVNAVRFIPGQGIVVDSSRTLSTNTLWLYVNVRLLFNFVKSSLKAGLRWVVQEPNDDTLWNKVKYNSVTPFLMGLWRRGAFGPGSPDEVFTVKVDAENNPPANIQQGILTVEIYFYPSRPAETIIIIIGQQEGGATASEG
jgi:phage tail sheath protein FI